MKNHKTYLFTLLFAGVCMKLAFAQADETMDTRFYKKSYWFDLGPGWGGQGAAFTIGFSYEIKANRFLSLRYSPVWTNDHCDEIALLIPFENPLGKSAEPVEISYGIIRKGKVSLQTLSAGLSYVKIETAEGSGPSTQNIPLLYYTNCPDNYATKNESTIGLVLRAQFIPSVRWGGIGISPYLNISPKYTFGSFTFNVALGRIRPRVS